MGIFSGIIGNASEADIKKVVGEYGKLLGNSEQVEKAFKLVRDMIIFTNKRLLIIDKQGLTAKKVVYNSIPYRAITNFKVETAGYFELEGELKVYITGIEEPVVINFNNDCNIYEVQGILAEYCG